MQRALVWLNLYGHEPVGHMLRNSLKTQKMHFLTVLSLCWTGSQPYRLGHTNALTNMHTTVTLVVDIFLKWVNGIASKFQEAVTSVVTPIFT